jgi:hypothetical protein
MQIVLEANIWIKVKSAMTLRSGKVIEKPTLEPCEKDDESIFKGEKRVKSEHCKEKTIPRQHFHFLIP